MRLKYKLDGDVMITEIGDVTINTAMNWIVFKPLDSELLAIRLRNAGSFAFDRIISDLFDTGKADITYLGEVELCDLDNEDDNEDEERK